MPHRFIEDLRARTTPGQRRAAAALALIAAVWVGARQLRGAVAREVELHVPLAALATGGEVHAVRVSFARGDEVLREVSQRWSAAPREMVARVSLPEGPCRAEVTVERGAQVLVRESAVEVRAGEALVLAAPTE